ncbi:hypothetical protein D9611_014150 [Ephemerocybe angulata]|uniref:F-box domain-containing protein n=1 Tax=Ephemerocybe angulata TaxID=980116 RepID=A0A8H5C4A7_9AGAR|nr:hypothetical protein D9611_014150 [Tulosesus angulatus]
MQPEELPHIALSHLIPSNDPPTPSETAFVRKAIKDIEQEAAAPSLRIPIRVLNSRLQEYRPILSPLRHVPLDVLGEIFAHAFTLEKSARPVTPSYQKLLPRVSRVCRSWREAALRTPELWRCMTINQKWGSGPPLAVVDAWIKRSGCLPRTLVFISNKCGKWHCLGAGECYLSNPAFQKLLQEGSPLDSLTVKCVRSFELWLPRIILAFPGCMTLTRKVLQLKFPKSWLKNLTSITLKSDLGPEHVFAILEKCINAEEVKLVTFFIRFNWSVNHPVLRRMANSGLLLPKLKSFYMVTDFEWLGFLQQLKMPLLEDLTLPFYQQQRFRPSTEHISTLYQVPFAEFIGNVSRIAESTLHRVKINNIYLHVSILLDILYSSLAGMHLILKNISFDDSAIANDATNPPFGQALRLGTVMLEDAQDDHENLKKFVENRGSRFTAPFTMTPAFRFWPTFEIDESTIGGYFLSGVSLFALHNLSYNSYGKMVSWFKTRITLKFDLGLLSDGPELHKVILCCSLHIRFRDFLEELSSPCA